MTTSGNDMKLIDLLELTFERPDVGTVNLRLLYGLIRSLITGLNIGDRVVDPEALIQPEGEGGGDEAGSSGNANDDNDDKDSSAEDANEGDDEDDGSKVPSGSSGASGSDQSDAGSITLDTGDRSSKDGTGSGSDDTSDDTSSGSGKDSGTATSKSKNKDKGKDKDKSKNKDNEQCAEITNLLRAYLVRLTALENDVATLKLKRTETLEMMSKLLDQLDSLESRFCEEQKKIARLSADLECLSLIVGQYEDKFDYLFRGLDHVEIDIREVKCNIRCIQKERDQFKQAVQTVTEQINHFSRIKADKEEVFAELALRAYSKDLDKYVPFDCFKVIQSDMAKSIALLHEEDYNLQTQLKASNYEWNKLMSTKADVADLEALRKQFSKLSQSFKQLEHRTQSRNKHSSLSAGVVLKGNRSSNCLACGDHASLDVCCYPVPQGRPLLPSAGSTKAKDIFTVRKRTVGGSHTKVTPEERLVRTAPIGSAMMGGIPSKLGEMCHGLKQIAGDDGCWYLADQETQI